MSEEPFDPADELKDIPSYNFEFNKMLEREGSTELLIYWDPKTGKRLKNGKVKVKWEDLRWFPKDVDPEKTKGLVGPLKHIYKEARVRIG